MTTKSDIDVAIEAILDKAAADARIAARARIVAQLASVTAKPAANRLDALAVAIIALTVTGLIALVGAMML